MTVSKKYNAHHYSALKDAQYCIWTISIYCTYSYWLFLKVNSTSYTETKSWTFIFTQDNKMSITVNLRTINEKFIQKVGLKQLSLQDVLYIKLHVKYVLLMKWITLIIL